MKTPFSTALALLIPLCAAARQPRPTTIGFDRPTYTAPIGATVTGSIVIDPVPAGGLYSQGTILTVQDRSGNLAGVVTPAPATVLQHDGPRLTGPRQPVSGNGTGRIKSSAAFSIERPTLLAPTIATFSIGNLPAGTYDLHLAPWNELGVTENIFVTGQSETLDPVLTFLPATIEIVGQSLPELTEAGPITLQRQTGLLEQRVTLSNTTGGTLTGFRILVGSLPDNVQLRNAHGRIDGVPYIDVLTQLAPGATVSLVLEYYRPSRDLNFIPTFTVARPGGPPPDPGSLGLLDVNLRVLRRDAGGLLVEFLSGKDRPYRIEYSDDLMTWKVSVPDVIGTGERIQWLDDGPPKTDSFPAANRFYRLTSE
jgi:hypothetical protein